jgi:hypothetical protein
MRVLSRPELLAVDVVTRDQLHRVNATGLLDSVLSGVSSQGLPIGRCSIQRKAAKHRLLQKDIAFQHPAHKADRWFRIAERVSALTAIRLGPRHSE